MKIFDFHHSVFPGEADQVSGATFMLSSVMEFGQILPFRLHPLWNSSLISIEICQEIELLSISYVLMM